MTLLCVLFPIKSVLKKPFNRPDLALLDCNWERQQHLEIQLTLPTGDVEQANSSDMHVDNKQATTCFVLSFVKG